MSAKPSPAKLVLQEARSGEAADVVMLISRLASGARVTVRPGQVSVPLDRNRCGKPAWIR
jgi:hypothetical protein